MESGTVVFSKAGKDKRKPFIVLYTEDGYAFLADGRLRPLHKPKKKKMKHIQPTNTVIADLKQKIENKQYMNDADIKKALLPYQPD